MLFHRNPIIWGGKACKNGNLSLPPQGYNDTTIKIQILYSKVETILRDNHQSTLMPNNLKHNAACHIILNWRDGSTRFAKIMLLQDPCCSETDDAKIRKQIPQMA